MQLIEPKMLVLNEISMEDEHHDVRAASKEKGQRTGAKPKKEKKGAYHQTPDHLRRREDSRMPFISEPGTVLLI